MQQSSNARAKLFYQKESQIKELTSASELTFFVCQLLTSPMKTEFQAILDQNDIEARMNLVANLIAKEVQVKAHNIAKQEALRKRIKERQAGYPSENEEGKSEVDEINSKLEKLELPEETKQICDREVRKLRQLGSRNQEYHVSLNYLETILDLPWNTS